MNHGLRPSFRRAGYSDNAGTTAGRPGSDDGEYWFLGGLIGSRDGGAPGLLGGCGGFLPYNAILHASSSTQAGDCSGRVGSEEGIQV